MLKSRLDRCATADLPFLHFQPARRSGYSPTNPGNALKSAAIAGAGIALLPDFTVIDDIETGRLVRVLPDWATTPAPIHALLPPGKFTAPKSRIFIELLKEFMSRAGAGTLRHASRSAT